MALSRFRFALQPLLDARRREEDELRDELAAAVRQATSECRRAGLSRDAFTHEARRFSDSALSLAPPTIRDALERLALLEAAMRSAESAARRSTACADSARTAFYPNDERREIIAKLARPRPPLAVDLAESIARA